MRYFPPSIRYFVLLMSVLFSSCVSQKELPYLQDSQYSTSTPVTADNTPPTYKVQANDIMSIQVQSTQPVLSTIFNPTSVNAFLSADPGNMYLTGYSVNDQGFINLPTIGPLKVQGLTVAEVQSLVQKEVSRYVKDANVLVKISSFKVTILGDVRNPGRYYIYNGQATVLEALGMAGDLNRLANRKNVKLIRQTPAGSEVVLLNLTDPNLLKSRYYYMLPNDALYVEPLKAQNERANLANLGLVFSGITTLALLLNYLNVNL